MRLAPALALSLTLAATPAMAQSGRCSPRVEATAAVPPAAVARLTAAISGSRAVSGACPVVRFDLVGGRFVMTVVLDDGRQVARVLPSQSDALPTLVALTATPLPAADPEPEALEAAATPAPAAVAPAAVVVAPVVVAPVVVAPAPQRAWQLRIGAAYGVTSAPRDVAQQVVLDVDVLLTRWAFGARAGFDFSPRRGYAGATAALSARRRWSLGRWQFDLGPAVAARWSFDDRGGVALRAGGEGSVGFALGRAWSVFARVDGGVDVLGGGDRRQERDRAGRERDGDDARLSYGAALGARWVLP